VEQIDGVVEIDGHLYFVEMKWWSATGSALDIPASGSSVSSGRKPSDEKVGTSRKYARYLRFWA